MIYGGFEQKLNTRNFDKIEFDCDNKQLMIKIESNFIVKEILSNNTYKSKSNKIYIINFCKQFYYYFYINKFIFLKCRHL